MNYYISDLHFGHKNVLKFDDRPFETVEEMNEVLVNNWNSEVFKGDNVFILGDMFWQNELAKDILPKLKGNKHLIIGNHDRINNFMKKHYISIDPYKRVKDNGKTVILCHYPIAHWDSQYRDGIHLHGHIHNTRDMELYEKYKLMCLERGIPFNAINVGCMMPYMEYKPRTLEYLTENCL